MFLIGPSGGFKLINNNGITGKPCGFKDEGLTETTRTLTFHIVTGTLEEMKVSKVAKIRNRYNQVPHLTQDTNGKVTNSQKTPQTRAKRSALSQQVTTKHI